MVAFRVNDLQKIKNNYTGYFSPAGRSKIRVIVHMGTCGIAAGAQDILKAVEQKLKENPVRDIELKTTGCAGLCGSEPMLTVEVKGYPPVKYARLTPEAVTEIFEKHILGGKPVQKYSICQGNEVVVGEEIISSGERLYDNLPALDGYGFFKDQRLIVMKNRALLDPESIDEYIARDGYMAAAKALLEMTPEQIIDEIKRSGLRGRGGAGFPTGLKWEFAHKSKGDRKFILCNADEGDPGAFMDRCVLESDPHSVLEGMIIGGRAIGATEGIIYVRAEYPLAVERLEQAIAQANERGLLGKNILGSDYSLTIRLYLGAGAFVCGEETALMRSIEGKRGTPRPRPPFPAHKGLWEMPSVLNNVETFANVPRIILMGADKFASMGTERSKGTKVFALSGCVNNVGLVEVPMGIKLRDIVYNIGGGIKGGRKFKAIQLGGPSGGCLPESLLDTPVDYESISKTGAIMGSGGMLVIDDSACMVDIAKFFLGFTTDESCGKCVPCRIGTRVMLDILNKITRGEGTESDIQKLESLAQDISAASLCGLGQTAPNPVLTTLRYFRHEYEAHVKEKYCPAGKCKRLSPTPCQAACPIGSDVSSYVALIGHGRYEEAVSVILEDNPLPGTLGRVCVHKCESACKRKDVDKAVSICALKRFATDRATDYLEDVTPCETKYQEKVAIVGAGPAGIACAYDLIRMGYSVTVFDMLDKGGGMLRAGIPSYRLPREILDAELRRLEKMGVVFEYGKKLGRDFTIQDLKKMGFGAIFLGIGAYKGAKLGLKGEGEVQGIYDCIEFLMKNNLKGKFKAGEKVLVIGGGNAAMDAARVSVRLGSDVHIVYRRTKAEMPANPSEIEAAIEEGVKMHFLVSPVGLLTQNGKITGLRCIKNELGEPDSSGRRKPVPIPGSEFDIEADAIISAIGQVPDTAWIDGKNNLRVSKNGTLEVNPETMETGEPGVFAGGDAVTGPATVVEAMGAGQKAAVSIHCFLRGKPFGGYKRPRPRVNVERIPVTPEELEKITKAQMPHLEVSRRIGCFDEVELGLDEKQALMEAKRCMRCDLESEE